MLPSWLGLACRRALAIGALVVAPHVQALQQIVYPTAETPFDVRSAYPIALLKLALREGGLDAQLVPSVQTMNQARAIRELTENRFIDVLWSMTTQDRENLLLPIRIPLSKGLIGWRIGLVRQPDAEALAQVDSIEALRATPLVQAHDWPDTQILRFNGFNVATSPSYSALFQMLIKHRVDMMPRSVEEIWDEANTYAPLGLVVEPHVLIHYQAALYFFVNKQNTELAGIIEAGLNRAIADGSFERLFRQYHQNAIDRAKLPSRRIFELKNPLLPAATPLDRKDLWFHLDDANATTGNAPSSAHKSLR